MFHIAIIDDDQSIHQKLEEMITSILFKYPIHFTCLLYTSDAADD